MNDHVIYRLLRKNELSDLLNLYKHLHSDDIVVNDSKLFEKSWDQICNNSNIFYFGAETDNKLVASCHLVIIPNLTRGCRPYGLIENVVTHTDFRSMGIGKRLLLFTLDTAWAHNCYKVMLMTGSKKEWIRKFYRDAGFQADVKKAYIATPIEHGSENSN
jgi:GNAT superfamily N-acetyltransferase